MPSQDREGAGRDQRAHARPWTEEEATAFTEALTSFRDSLPPRQCDAFAAILQTAAAAGVDPDVQGYFFYLERPTDEILKRPMTLSDRYTISLSTRPAQSAPQPYYPPGMRTDAAR